MNDRDSIIIEIHQEYLFPAESYTIKRFLSATIQLTKSYFCNSPSTYVSSFWINPTPPPLPFISKFVSWTKFFR